MTASKVLFDDNREYLESLKPEQAAILEATTYANFAKTHRRETGYRRSPDPLWILEFSARYET